jgi:GH15 family glucan-1,4-alpha-glucosidase
VTAPPGNLDLGVIGNCQVSALIDQNASIVWACLPRPDADPVFCSLLRSDRSAGSVGSFAVQLVDCVESKQSYQRNSAILETVLQDSHGASVRITDFCPRFRARGRMHRPAMIVRIVEPCGHRPVIQLSLRPMENYGQRSCVGQLRSHSIRFTGTDANYRVTTNASLCALMEQRPIGLDQPLAFILGPDETLDDEPLIFAQSLLSQTRVYWQDWVRTLAVPFDWQAEVIRAAITLKLCTFEDTGAVLAALTTSIPEAPDSGRNWDYRYCWLRDSYFVIKALNRLGATRTMEAFLQFLDHIVDAQQLGKLQPLYSISGERRLTEQVVQSLDGFRGMGPVRVGNQAATQTQHDVYGSIILATSQLFFDERLIARGDQSFFARLETLGQRAAEHYDQPDAGPWEYRERTKVHTFSAAMSWAGCDRLARIAHLLGRRSSESHWRSTADTMRDRILTCAWSPARNSFVGTFDGRELDATSLLLSEIGIIPAADTRFKQTVATIGKSLRRGDLIFRYLHDDDFGAPESAFTVCAFWYVNALASVGHLEEARDHFSRLLALSNPLGLLSEDIDPRTNTQWGNYPQTYSMVGVINSALRLSRSWEDAL